MASTDTFPVPAHWPVGRPEALNVLRSRAGGGAEFRRLRAAPQRIFRLQFSKISKADWQSIQQFHRRLAEDYFIWVDAEDGNRGFPVYFNSDLQDEQAGNEQVNVQVELIEAVGQAPAAYAQTPLIVWPVSKFVAVGNSKFITYGGYGFTMAATGVTDMKVDGVSVGAASPVWNINLGLHVLEVIGAAPPDITAFSFVE